MADFKERLKFLRESKGTKQKDLASFLDITEQSYQRYEYGTREPDIAVLMRLAGYFGVSVDFLIGYSDTPKRAK